jgi:ElaB/YqjD/DUF883 family membrane-anchored ribosome-binding protein
MSNPSDSFRAVQSDAKDRLASDFSDLKSNFAQLRSDVGAIVGNALGAGKAQARGGVDAARGQANVAVDRAREEYEHLKAKGSDQYEQLGEFISERPVTSALIAFGVGFIVAKVLVRR